MKHPKRQAVSSSNSRESRREATARGRRIQAATDLTNCPNFDLQYGDDYEGGHPCSYYTLQYRGVKAHLRFDYMWMVKVPSLGIEKNFLNQVPQDLASEIEAWIDEQLPQPTSQQALLRQSTPAVKEFAARHGISVSVADEIAFERGF